MPNKRQQRLYFICHIRLQQRQQRERNIIPTICKAREVWFDPVPPNLMVKNQTENIKLQKRTLILFIKKPVVVGRHIHLCTLTLLHTHTQIQFLEHIRTKGHINTGVPTMSRWGNTNKYATMQTNERTPTKSTKNNNKEKSNQKQ